MANCQFSGRYTPIFALKELLKEHKQQKVDYSSFSVSKNAAFDSLPFKFNSNLTNSYLARTLEL